MQKMRIGLQLAWLNDGTHANFIGDAGIAESWAKWLRRREDVEYAHIGHRMRPSAFDVIINFHPGLSIDPGCKYIMYHQNAWDESFHPGGTIGVFHTIKELYHGYLFPSEKLRQLCGGVGATIPFACDSDEMTYQYDEKFVHKVAFVGNCIRPKEINDRWILPLVEQGLVLYGGPWPSEYSPAYRGRLPQENLAKVYSSSHALIDVHIPEHLKHGVINSRVYDILACGGLCVTDMPDCGEFSKFVIAISDYDEPEFLRKPSHSMDRRDFVLAAHTWEHRVSDLVKYLKEIV